MERQKLGKLLVDKGIITGNQLDSLLREQEESPESPRLGALAIAHGFIDERMLTVVLGGQLGVPIVLHLDRIDVDPRAVELLPQALAEKFLVAPLSLYGEPERLVVCTSDPTDKVLFRAIEQAAGVPVTVAVAPRRDVVEAIDRLYHRHALPGTVEEVLTSGGSRA